MLSFVFSNIGIQTQFTMNSFILNRRNWCATSAPCSLAISRWSGTRWLSVQGFADGADQRICGYSRTTGHWKDVYRSEGRVTLLNCYRVHDWISYFFLVIKLFFSRVWLTMKRATLDMTKTKSITTTTTTEHNKTLPRDLIHLVILPSN